MRRFKIAYLTAYLLMATWLAASTFMSPSVYSSLWFVAGWAVLGAGLVWLMVATKMWKRPALFLLHLSLLVILLGGAITRYASNEGELMLGPGQPAVETYIDSNGEVQPLGAQVHLIEFIADPFKGYESWISVDGRDEIVKLNSPLRIGRIYLSQKSFTAEGVSILGVRDDLAGTTITFVGYALFLIGGLMMLVNKARRPRHAATLLLLLPVLGSAKPMPVLRTEVVDSLERVSVYYQGRPVTVSTVCSDLMQKVSGKRSWHGLSASEAMLSFSVFPEKWSDAKIIKTPEGHKRLRDFFDTEGRYILPRDQVQTDERVGLLVELMTGKMFQPLPEGIEPLSPAKTAAEIIYNHVPWTLITFIVLFLAAIAAFIGWKVAAISLGSLGLALLLAAIGVQWWLTGHGPFNGTFETLQLLAAICALVGLAMRSIMAPALLASGCMALVAHLQHSNPMMTPLMPVLHSPWLSIHVTLVMLAYALLVVIGFTALWGIIRPKLADEMRKRAMKLLGPAVWLLGLGIFTGAVWANVSWGRYWGWDPKETWALVTFMLYAIPLHIKRPPLWMLVAPLASVAMTYFGVNLLPSLHAYS